MPFWIIALLMMAASYLLTTLMMKRTTQKPASLEDFEFPQSDEGTPQTVVFGDGWLTGPMVIGFWNFRTKKIKAKGKK